MSHLHENPLRKSFRNPTCQYTPASGKIFYDMVGESDTTKIYDVFPMTTKDEINTKNPDLLISGKSTILLIQSCIPDIKNPWNIPAIEIDAILITIRIATYGNSIDIEHECNECKKSNTFGIDLFKCISSINIPNYGDPITTNTDALIFLKPLSYNESTIVSKEMLTIQKKIEQIDVVTDEDKKQKFLSDFLDDTFIINLKTLTMATNKILSGSDTVDDKSFIYEFYENSSKLVIEQIKEKMEKNANLSSVKSHDVACGFCEAINKIAIDFDYSNFFAKSS